MFSMSLYQSGFGLFWLGASKSQGIIRVTAQLIDALKGNHLWSERYDSELKDIFALQDDVTK